MCVYIYSYNFFIHSSVSEHLDGFHILTTMSNAAMNMVDSQLFEVLISFPLGIHSEKGLMDHTLVLFLVFEELQYIFQ